MRKHWWKFLGVALVLYSLIAGLLIPIGPGIVAVTPSGFNAGGQVAIDVTGYNTHYTQGELNAWLRFRDLSLQAAAVSFEDDRHVTLTFNVPQRLPSLDSTNAVSLLLHSSVDGISVLPDALFILKSHPSKEVEGWQEFTQVEPTGGVHFPYRNILQESIRNLYYHVPLWFALMIVLAFSMVHAVRYLRKPDPVSDLKSKGYAASGLLLGLLGLATGAMWAGYAWGAFWSFDVKQNMAAIAMIIYLAYFILRNALDDPDLSARFSAVYNIFAYSLLIPLLYIFPRMVDSLHPGSGGNPAMGGEDLDNTMRMVFYPAVIGWILIGLWLGQLRARVDIISLRIGERSK